jgi:hypothetical protein
VASVLVIWLSNRSCSHVEPTVKSCQQAQPSGAVIGFEIITLGNLKSEDMRKRSANARALLKQRANRLSIISRLHK